MKKTLSILLTLAFAFSSLAVSAQDQQEKKEKKDSQLFNHLAVGVSAGVDGIGGGLAITCTPFLQIRGGYSVFPYTYTASNLSILPETIEINDKSRNLRDNASIAAKFNTGGPHLMLDIFPGRYSAFHFTVGAYFGKESFIDVDIDASKVLQPDEYASVYYELKENDPDSRISSDENGHVHAAMNTNAFKPYFGVGFGRAVDRKGFVKFTFDLGVIYWQQAKLQAYNYTGIGSPTVTVTSEMLDNHDDGLIDKYVSNIPVFPMIKFNLYFRLF